MNADLWFIAIDQIISQNESNFYVLNFTVMFFFRLQIVRNFSRVEEKKQIAYNGL